MTYSVQPANLTTDKQAMLSVWGSSLTHSSAERFAWIYERNPFGPVSSWVVKDSESVLAGAASVFPRELQVGSTSVSAGIAGDLAVHKDHRVLGPAVMLQRATVRACESGSFDLVYGFPNPRAEAAERRAGYKVLGPVSRLRRQLRSKRSLARRTGSQVAAVAAPLLDLALRAACREDLIGRGFTFRVENKFDSCVDRLWATVSSRLPITGVRTAKYLNWRFTSCPHKHYQVFSMYDSSNELRGYAVYYVRDHEAVICDVLATDFGAELKALIAGLLRHQRKLGVDSVYCRYFGTSRLTSVLKRFGFTEKREGNVVFCISQKSRLAMADLGQENWYLLDGDADL